jgi:hypothetical protein
MKKKESWGDFVFSQQPEIPQPEIKQNPENEVRL